MPRLLFHPGERWIEVASGTILLDAITAAHLPLARACGGEALCGRCGVGVCVGADRLSSEDAEETRAKRRNRVPPTQRLACRARLLGDATITSSAW